ncbi:MAG: hypothetical protein Q9198_009660 [Flavoplaca austrocitrina]
MNRQAIRSSLVQSKSTVRFPRLRQASRSGHIRALYIAPRILKPKLVNVAVYSAFCGYRGYLPSEPSQIANPSRFRTHTTQSDRQESKDDSADGHKKDSLSLGDSEAGSGTSATVTMTKRDFDAIVKEKAESLRQLKKQQRFTFALVLVTLVMIAGVYYTAAIARKIEDHGTINYQQWTFGKSPKLRRSQEETPGGTKEDAGEGGTEKDEDRSIPRLGKDMNGELIRVQTMMEDELNQVAKEAFSVIKDRRIPKNGTRQHTRAFPHRDEPAGPP